LTFKHRISGYRDGEADPGRLLSRKPDKTACSYPEKKIKPGLLVIWVWMIWRINVEWSKTLGFGAQMLPALNILQKV